jgi:3-oxoacyl-[acyl-carrier protein] reductase
MTFEGKVVIVTGGSMGIGRAVASAFAANGAQLLLVARSPGPLAETREALRRCHRGVEAMTADVGSPEEAERVVARALELFGGLDVLVNNAGVYGPIGSVHEVDPGAWLETFRINCFGTFCMSRAAVPALIARGGGRIINMSGGGALSPFPNFSAYAISKAAVVRLTENLAEELRPYDIQVNAIAPGMVATRLHRLTLEAGERAGQEFLEKTRRTMDEGGVPAETPAELALYLASPETAGLTGRVISAVWDDWKSIHAHVGEIMEGDVYTMRRIVPRDRGYQW